MSFAKKPIKPPGDQIDGTIGRLAEVCHTMSRRFQVQEIDCAVIQRQKFSSSKN